MSTVACLPDFIELITVTGAHMSCFLSSVTRTTTPIRYHKTAATSPSRTGRSMFQLCSPFREKRGNEPFHKVYPFHGPCKVIFTPPLLSEQHGTSSVPYISSPIHELFLHLVSRRRLALNKTRNAHSHGKLSQQLSKVYWKVSSRLYNPPLSCHIDQGLKTTHFWRPRRAALNYSSPYSLSPLLFHPSMLCSTLVAVSLQQLSPQSYFHVPFPSVTDLTLSNAQLNIFLHAESIKTVPPFYRNPKPCK